jgi:hypothetical protein
MKFHRVTYLLGVVAICCAGAVQATEIVPLSTAQLGERSTTVVRGEVADVRSFWNARRTKIFTEVVIDVAEAYKGAAGGQVRLLQLGGTVDGVRVTVHGALQWTTGEEVLLFLEPYQGDAYHVAGFSQGKFQVERDDRTGRAYVSRPALAGVEFAATGAAGEAAGANVTREPLDRFVGRALGRDETINER